MVSLLPFDTIKAIDDPKLVGTGVVFERSLEGQTLTFQMAESASDGLPKVKDAQTGSLWQTLRGQAVEGPLKGKALRKLPITYSFWFGWRDFFPDTELFQSGGA